MALTLHRGQASKVPEIAAGVDAEGLARALVARLGGRYSAELGIDVDRGGAEVERWFLAATLFGNRIRASVAMRTYRALADAGVAALGDVEGRSWSELVELLDAGGYVRYDYRTASRLQALARAVRERLSGRVASLAAVSGPGELEAALDALPGWGPVTVRLFLRELQGTWPGADPGLGPRAMEAGRHVGLLGPARAREQLRSLAGATGLDVRDLEVALVRLSIAHGRRFGSCPGGSDCAFLRQLGARASERRRPLDAAGRPPADES